MSVTAKQDSIAVSVIVLTYNHEKYIRQALDSILMQKVEFKYEILVGDDASTDKTAEILKEYGQGKENIRLFLRTENMGAARNAYDLLMNAKGHYLAFCEGDDYWVEDNKLALQVSYLENHPEFIGCSSHCLLVDEGGRTLRNQRLSWVKYKKRFTLKDYSGGRYLPGQTSSIVKKNIFLNAGDEEFSILYQANKYISDRTSTAIYLTKGDFSCIPMPLSAYRKFSRASGTNLTNQVYRHNKHKCIDELKLTECIEDYVSAATGRKTFFALKRCDILTDAVIGLLRNPNGFQLKTLCMVAKECPIYGWIYIPYAIARKYLYHLKNRQAETTSHGDN